MCAVDGVLYVQIVDAVKASYGVDNIPYATVQLAQTVMRSELGKMTLDRTFQERDSLNQSIVKSLNEATEPWGLRCLRHEIRLGFVRFSFIEVLYALRAFVTFTKPRVFTCQRYIATVSATGGHGAAGRS